MTREQEIHILSVLCSRLTAVVDELDQIAEREGILNCHRAVDELSQFISQWETLVELRKLEVNR